MLAVFMQEFYICLMIALIKVETCRNIMYRRTNLNILAISLTPLLLRLVVTFNCHLLSAHGMGRFPHYYGDCAIMNTVKIAYSVPDDELVISS